MFANDWALKRFLQPSRRRRGLGRVMIRVMIVVVGLMLASGQLAHGSGGARFETAVVEPGDTVWTIAEARYTGDPRPHVDAILELNRLRTPLLWPGQRLRIPIE